VITNIKSSHYNINRHNKPRHSHEKYPEAAQYTGWTIKDKGYMGFFVFFLYVSRQKLQWGDHSLNNMLKNTSFLDRLSSIVMTMDNC